MFIYLKMTQSGSKMICNDNLCFIHVPKAAGMSLSDFLLKNLKNKPIHYFLPEGHSTAEEKNLPDVQIHPGTRHENLPQAQNYLESIGKTLYDFEVVFTIIRNPYDLEVSRFKYLQIGNPWDSGPAAKLAQTGNFSKFAQESLFWGKKTAEFENFYTLDGKYLNNMKILRFEDLNNQIDIQLKQFINNTDQLKKINSTERKTYHEYVDSESEKYIYKMYQWVFDQGYYCREVF